MGRDNKTHGESDEINGRENKKERKEEGEIGMGVPVSEHGRIKMRWGKEWDHSQKVSSIFEELEGRLGWGVGIEQMERSEKHSVLCRREGRMGFRIWAVRQSFA